VCMQSIRCTAPFFAPCNNAIQLTSSVELVTASAVLIPSTERCRKQLPSGTHRGQIEARFMTDIRSFSQLSSGGSRVLIWTQFLSTALRVENALC